ncbi:MAG: hypothetical protein J6X07_11370 [Prevotella sp.]|nr:hypothetical protein [Prevotella sp.]
MKDWKVWAFCIALFLLVKMCGGCNGCGSSGLDTDALEIRLIGKYHYTDVHINSYKKVKDDPPTFEFEYDYTLRSVGIRQTRTGHCTLYPDGDFKDIY